ncbi:hypothetical protein WNY37_17875 [Henriciella sp. AS95]|uniref:hypothetical protein n=1 Tax=Henriciella sp. AS95 TaxID=3135782 RepID=UPI00317BAFD6
MKPKTARTLTKLVALRRQNAEQAMGQAKMSLDEAKAKLAALEAELRAAPGGTEQDYAALSLSDRFGNSQRILGQIEAQKSVVATCEETLAIRRNLLKQAFGSEQSLKEIVATRK